MSLLANFFLSSIKFQENVMKLFKFFFQEMKKSLARLNNVYAIKKN